MHGRGVAGDGVRDSGLLGGDEPGHAKPLHLALLVQRFRREVRAPFPPAWMVQTAMAPPAALARVRGHAARYEPLPTLA